MWGQGYQALPPGTTGSSGGTSLPPASVESHRDERATKKLISELLSVRGDSQVNRKVPKGHRGPALCQAPRVTQSTGTTHFQNRLHPALRLALQIYSPLETMPEINHVPN